MDFVLACMDFYGLSKEENKHGTQDKEGRKEHVRRRNKEAAEEK